VEYGIPPPVSEAEQEARRFRYENAIAASHGTNLENDHVDRENANARYSDVQSRHHHGGGADGSSPEYRLARTSPAAMNASANMHRDAGPTESGSQQVTTK
jgi:hypothetical protein